ncbi:MAG: helix-turn-helix transcriptional regulator [Clostridia bacterium]|nr:helix-turn-helix transcriptional regulator [Clostridia bacterium]
MEKLYFRNVDILNTKSKQSNEYSLIVNFSYDCFKNDLYAYDTYNSQGRDDYYIIYVVDGIFNTKINNTVFHLKKGAVILYPPKYKYRYWGEPPSRYLCAHFTGSHVEKILTDLGFPIEHPYILEGEFSPKIKNLFDKMDEQYMTNAPFLQYSLSCLLEQILLTIAVERVKSEGYRTFKKSIKYIYANYTEKIQIPYLAKLEGLSNSRFITLFSKDMGKTPSEYILDLRLGRACELLVATDKQISSIGTAVGYKDQYFFSKIFKKHMGISPLEYRKKNK